MDARASVLIVDDDELLRRTLRSPIGRFGARVIEVATGTAALAEVEREEPALVILDMGLPDIGGMDVLMTLRDQHPEVGVVVFSGSLDGIALADARRLGALESIAKPDTSALLAWVKSFLAARVEPVI